MCGRYNLLPQSEAWAAGLGILADILKGESDRLNIHPGASVPVFPYRQTKHPLLQATWGYRPIWADQEFSGPKPINTRADSLGKGFWNGAKRCIFPMTGFYEPGKPSGVKWKKGETRRYYLYRETDGLPLFAAGLLSGGGHPTASIITVPANQTVAKSTHDRMPALLKHDLALVWLSGDYKTSELRDLLVSADDELLKPTPVTSLGDIPEPSD